jgi:hippurate hydrolase
MLRKKPGAFVFLGTGTEHALHTPRYDFNDAIIPHGVGFFVNLVKQELG